MWAFLQLVMRPMASLLAVVLGWKFVEGELGNVFSEESTSPQDLEKRTASTFGLVAGIIIGGMLMGGLGGKRSRR